LSAAALSTALPAQSIDATLNRALTAHNGAKTLRASFRQVISNPLTGTSATARGELMMRKPDEVHVKFTDPSGDVVLADGRFLWVYLPSQNPRQVIRLPQSRSGGTGGIDVIGQFFDNPRERYAITDAGSAKVGGRATRALRLVPKQRNGTFTRAVVWIDDKDGQLRQFEVTDANGLVRRIELTNVRVNAKLPSNAFTFMLPKGASVVDQPRMP
jgi:outer membrane lipoprotein carrier protein